MPAAAEAQPHAPQAPEGRATGGNPSALKYRPEIDGLRALAVLPVILFHAGFGSFGGGYVGVDVFFVISGYLITALIMAERSLGRFSLLHFYERRARRILPALTFVLAACLPAAWLWLLPSDLLEFTQSLGAVSLFVSNFFFWSHSGYFETAAELKPLLHTWSLAVEEQFYLFFPWALMLLWPLGRRGVALALAAVALASLAYAQWACGHAPVANFFLPWGRAWELLLGALLAVYEERRGTHREGAFASFASLAGLGLIVLSVVSFDRATPFPSLWAAVPALGAGLVLAFAGPRGLAGRLLASRPLVMVGLISYSAYLWHQPLLAFARHRLGSDLTPAMLATICASTLPLAALSWRFIEQPFRRPQGVGRRALLASASAATLGMLCMAWLGRSSEGYFLREGLRTRTSQIEQRLTPNQGLHKLCDGAFTLAPECRTHPEPQLVVWGDSFAMHLVQGLLASAPQLGLAQMTVSVCGPLFGIAPIGAAPYNEAWARECIKTNDRVRDWLAQNPSVKYVVLGSPFFQYVDPQMKVLQRDGQVVAAAGVARQALTDTLAMLKALGLTAVVFSPPPKDGQEIGRCLVRSSLLELDRRKCDIEQGRAESFQAATLALLRQIERDGHPVIWLHEGLCQGRRCRASDGEVLIYADNQHLSREGSAYLGRQMRFMDRIVDAASRR